MRALFGRRSRNRSSEALNAGDQAATGLGDEEEALPAGQVMRMNPLEEAQRLRHEAVAAAGLQVKVVEAAQVFGAAGAADARAAMGRERCRAAG